MASREIIALNETTPQLLAPQAGDNYLAPRKILVTPEVNTNALAVTGFSLTGSNASSLVDLAGTWNTSGTPTALKLNVTNTASNAASLLMDLQVGGSGMFQVRRSGDLHAAGAYIGGTPFTNTAAYIGTGQVILGTSVFLNWNSDVGLYRDAANTLAQRNGTAAQAFNLYQSYTDASNYTRAKLSAASSIVTLAAESAGTGDANIDIALTPKGTGAVRMGTHSAVAAETVTGYVTIKDAGGTTRKIAVIS